MNSVSCGDVSVLQYLWQHGLIGSIFGIAFGCYYLGHMSRIRKEHNKNGQ